MFLYSSINIYSKIMAKKFNFRLESVLKLRSEKVAQAQDSLFQAQKVRIEKENIIQSYNELKRNLGIEGKQLIKASSLQAISNRKAHLDTEIKRLDGERKQILEIEELRRQKLTKAMIEEKALEKLKEKRMIEHNNELKSEEIKFFDEVARNNNKEI